MMLARWSELLSFPMGAFRAFIWSGGYIQDLGTLGGDTSVARRLNDSGEVVGASKLLNSKVEHAFIYRGGQMFDLGTLGGDNSDAECINNFGEVVGRSDTQAIVAFTQSFSMMGMSMTFIR
jgi:probable HAF family extracellular repeat protein